MKIKSFFTILLEGSFLALALCLSLSCAGSSTPGWEKMKEISLGMSVRANNAGFLNEKFGITVGYAGEIHRTDDGGNTWTKADNTSACRFGLEIIDEQTAIAGGNYAQVRKSVDGGKTWTPIDNFGGSEPHHCRYVSFIDPETGWIASEGELGSTRDGGETWQKIGSSKELSTIIALDLFAKDSGAILNDKGELYVTSDNGKTWNKAAFKLEVNAMNAGDYPLVAMRFADAQTGMIVAYQLKTHSWTAYSIQNGEITGHAPVTDEMSSISSVFMNRDCSLITLKDEGNKIAVFKKAADKS